MSPIDLGRFPRDVREKVKRIPERKLDDITAELSIDHSVIEGHFEELIVDGPPLSELSDAVSGFLKGLLDEVRRDWKELIDDFFLRHRFRPEGTVPADTINVRIGDHPGILWSLERLKKTGVYNP